MNPAWFKLIEQWRDTKHFGLSIPFLVGALREWPDHPLGNSTSGDEQLRALLTSVRDEAPEGVVMRLYSCDKLQDLALARVGQVPQRCISFPSSVRSESALYVEEGIIAGNGEAFEELVHTLWKRYKRDIEAGRFSRRAGAFHPLDESDKKLIRAAAARPDDNV